jgi:hypothetical protein
VERIYVTYRLRTPEHAEAYERWSRERDQVVVREQEGVLGFEVYMVDAAESRERGGAVCDIIEEITVSSWEAFQKALGTEPMQELGREFGEVADPASVTTLRTRPL